MSKQINELTHGKHEAYYSYQDFMRIQKAYEKCKIDPNDNPYALLICAKASYVMGKYKECLKILNKVKIDHSTKILFERQALLIKALFLAKDIKNREKQIQKAYEDFQYYKNKCPGEQLLPNHFHDMQKLKQLAVVRSQIVSGLAQDKRSIYKTLQSFRTVNIYPGLPYFLISKTWNDQLNDYLSKDGEYPGSCLNFQLLNHVFQFQKHRSKSKRYLNTLLFPLLENEHYFALTKNHWEFVHRQFGGFPIQRMIIEDPENQSPQSGDNTFRTLIQIDKMRIILQWQKGIYWQYTILPTLWKQIGKGQLKQETRNKQYLLIKSGIAQRTETDFKYILIEDERIVTRNSFEQKQKNRLLTKFDMEHYEIERSVRQGKVGLQNLGNTCYMNSALQCLSQIPEFSEYFFTNQHLSQLNLDETNKDGSLGEITCAFAQIIKRLWFCSIETPYITPIYFKQMFENRFTTFYGYQQQDAQQFLIFLLDCLHADLNQKSRNQQAKMYSSAKNIREAENQVVNEYQRNNKSIIIDKFIGFHSTTIECRKCHKESYRFEHFLMFQVDLPQGNPTLDIYLFQKNKKPETPIKIQIYIDDFRKMKDVYEKIRDAEKIAMDLQNYSYILDENYKIIKQLKESQDCKELYHELSKHKNKNFYCFLFVLPEIQNPNEQEFSFVEFYYERDGKEEVVAIPRLIMIKKQMKFKSSEKDLLKHIAENALPPNGLFQKSRIQQLERASITNSQNTSHKTLIKVIMNEKLRQFNYKIHKRILGEGIKKMEITLENCLFTMSQNQIISEEEEWVCKKCKCIREAIRSDKIFSTPQILIFHLKRFTHQSKVTTRIEYPVRDFDMTPFVYSRSNRMKYDLIGVILHLGTINRGHYKAYCFHQMDQKWYIYDDQQVKEINQQYIIDHNAYILVYKRK